MAEALDPALPAATDRLARQVLEDACQQGLKLVTAESCTGGLLASLLTDIPGCSHAFERGFVTYTDEAKHELLGVPLKILEQDGAVSERAARAMAEGALANSPGDIAVAITGFTESGPGPGQPGGLVHFAAVRRGQPTDHRVVRFGEVGRADVRLKALDVALGMMRAQMIRTVDAA
jgi:nicotinamide-nucleotide amidase